MTFISAGYVDVKVLRRYIICRYRWNYFSKRLLKQVIHRMKNIFGSKTIASKICA